MTTFVLVHGAWHGGWCWKYVRQALAAHGHEVFTPTLTGLCDRSHLLSREIDLETHITDVVNLIRWEGLSDVVLCGHSYGGCVVTGAADRASDRIRALVYLDAFTPGDGESLMDVAGPGPMAAMVAGAEEGWKLPPVPAAMFNVNPADRAWVDRNCTPQPAATITQPLRLTGGLAQIATMAYLVATGGKSTSPFARFYEAARDKGWRTRAFDCGHDVMIDMPVALTEELLSIAAVSAPAPAMAD